MMASTSQNSPRKSKGGSKKKTAPSLSGLDAKKLRDDLVKIFGTAELSQMDGNPTPPDNLQKLVDSVKKSGIAGCGIDPKKTGFVIKHPFSDKPFETYL